MSDSSDLNILLVEDDPADAALFKAGFWEGGLRPQISVAKDGQQALDCLSENGDSSSAQRPHLIVLDLDLPKIDGCQVLREIKADQQLQCIPVVILSGSVIVESILGESRHQVAGILSKPTDLRGYIEVAGEISQIWNSVGQPST